MSSETDVAGASGSTRLREPALRAFFRLSEVWKLSEEEQMCLLGVSSLSTLTAWKAGRVDDACEETVTRISYLLGIFKAINTLLPEAGRADAWIRSASSGLPFNGRSALDQMMRGQVSDLSEVRRYLEAQLV